MVHSLYVLDHAFLLCHRAVTLVSVGRDRVQCLLPGELRRRRLHYTFRTGLKLGLKDGGALLVLLVSDDLGQNLVSKL